MSPELEIRQQVAAYLSGTITFEAFEDQFVALTWNAPDEPTRRLASWIEHCIADYTGGALGPEDLRESLIPFAMTTTHSAIFGPAPRPSVELDAIDADVSSHKVTLSAA